MKDLRVIVSFKLKEKDLDIASTLLSKFVLAAREQSGCVSFEFVKSADQANSFFFLEHWENEQANQHHIRSENFRRFAPFFATYFEKLKVSRSYSFLNETSSADLPE